MTFLEESEALHRRVREFAECSDDTFERLALDIARFQERHSPRLRNLAHARGSSFESVAGIPAVPVEAFRLTRVAVHPEELDEACFLTSGTTSQNAGRHYFRTTQTYRELALQFGHKALMSAWDGPAVVVALAPVPEARPSSSLSFMMKLFMEAFDGRALSVDPSGAEFDPFASERWLASAHGVDVAGLRRAALIARERQEPLLVLATAFALVSLVDGLSGEVIPCPKRSLIMQTGGFKGKTRTLAPAELERQVARAFRIPESHVVGEYGMTELSSQLYQGGLPGGALSAPRGVYVEPPWLRVVPVDPASLEPVPLGDTGIAKIIDLGNVDSAVAIVTQDLVRRRGPGIELLGRRPGATPRGCSLSLEALLAPSTR